MNHKPIRLFSRAAMLFMMMLTTQTAWAWSGSGTSADPYKIANANDLIQLATDVNGGETYSNKYFQQTAPITLTSAWTPIGTSTHPFKGHYDGGNNAISGLTVSGNYKYAGLFGYISSDRVNGSLVSNELQNINIVDCNINVGSSNNSGSKAGGIAGQTGPVHLSDCRVSGTITAYDTACGLVGYADQSYGNSVTNCFVDVTISATGKQYNQYANPIARLMLSVQANTPTASGNYYHDNGGNVTVGCSATQLYTVGVPSGLTVAETNATVTFNNKNYFATNANATLTVDDADKAIKSLTATGTGASSSVADDKKSADITLGSSDVTVSATLMAISGTSNGLTWSMSDSDSDGTYDRLTLSGSGTLSTSPWATDFAASITRVDISSADIAISGNPFSTLADGVDIVAPSPAYAVSYASAGFATKLRVQLGSYLFTATNEGGTPAYAITSYGDLQNLSSAVKDGNSGEGKTFRQTGNIRLGDSSFEPIGFDPTECFSGTYDGGGYTISNLHVNFIGFIGNNVMTYGLFGYVRNGLVENVRLVSPSVNVSNANDLYYYGALIGCADGTNGASTTIRNCVVISPKINASGNWQGAIIGVQNNCNLQNLYFYGGNCNNAIGGGYSGTDAVRAYKVTLGSGVSIQTEMAADLGFSYDSDGTPENYWREGAKLTLANNLSIPTGYHAIYKADGNTLTDNTYTVSSADGDVTLTTEYTNNTYTVKFNGNGGTCGDGEMSDMNFTYDEAQNLTANAFTRTGCIFAGWATSANGDVVYSDQQSVSNLTTENNGTVTLYAKWDVPYIDADGNTQYCSNFTVLTNSTDISNLSKGWYVVAEDVSYSSWFRCGSGDIHLILCDNAKMTVEINNNSEAIRMGYGSLTIYAQSTGSSMGKLIATSTDESGIYVVGSVTICGGNITATGKNSNGCAGIGAFNNITIHSGQVSASGDKGIRTNGAITLGLRNATDYITVSKYYGTVNIAQGQTLIDGTAAYSGNNVSIPGGKTLTPARIITLPEGITATSGIVESGNNKYASAGATVTISATEPAPEGYTYSITVSPTADVTDNGNGTYSFTMPAANATVSVGDLRSDGQSHSISYMDENGDDATHDAIALDGTETTLDAGWYFVGKDINYTQTVNLDGDVNIILTDGKTMNIGTRESYIKGSCINGSDKTLTIYGQSNQSGTLNAYNFISMTLATVAVKNYTQHGGNLNATGKYFTIIPGDLYSYVFNGNNFTISGGNLNATGNLTATGKFAMSGGTATVAGLFNTNDLDFSGGNLTANGNTYGIYTSGTVSLSWTSLDDSFYASSYNGDGKVTIADGKAFADEDGNIYTGTLSSDEKSKLNGKTLTPACIITLPEGLTATGVLAQKGTTAYAKAGDAITLAVASGYQLNGDITYTPDGGSATATTEDNGSYSFTMPAGNVTVNANIIKIISYIDADGKLQTITNYKKFPAEYNLGWELTTTTLNAGEWYVVDDNIDINNITDVLTVSGSGAANIILCDGKKLEMSHSKYFWNYNCGISGDITIYGQSAGTGQLKIYGNNGDEDWTQTNYKNAFQGTLTMYGGHLFVKGHTGWSDSSEGGDRMGAIGGTINMYGGTLEAEGGDTYDNYKYDGTNAINGNVNFYGGSLTAIGGKSYEDNGFIDGFGIDGKVTLNWSNANDSFYASSYCGDVTIASGKAFYNGSEVLSNGEVSDNNKLAGKTLRPFKTITLADNADNSSTISEWNGGVAEVTLSGRTLYMDGDWNTLCLPFALSAEQIAASPLAGATIMELDGTSSDLTNGTLTLNFNDAKEMVAGRPYIVKWPIARTISTTGDWHDFVEAVAGGNTYEGKIVRLAADIEVSEMVGTSEHKFKGFFDGQGHTLTLNSLSASGEEACAPFRYVEDATIDNLHTTGTVIADNNTASKYRSGLVGVSDGFTFIHNCWSSVTISSNLSGDGTHGGFIGVSSGNAGISNCRYDGRFIGNNTTCWGGFVGWSNDETVIYNSVFAPEGLSIDQDGSATFSRNQVSTTNCYYSEALNNETNDATAIGTTSAEDLAEALGSGWQVKDGKAVPVTVSDTIILVNPEFTGVTVKEGLNDVTFKGGSFKGTYAPINWVVETPSILFVGENNQLHWPLAGAHLNAFRAYFELADGEQARSFNMTFGEETSDIVAIDNSQFTIDNSQLTIHNEAGAWYDMQGRKVNGKPVKKGLYIFNGKKVVIK